MKQILVEIVIIFLLLLVNGVFAMTEIAVVSARKARLRRLAEEGRGRERLCVLKLALAFFDQRERSRRRRGGGLSQFVGAKEEGVVRVGQGARRLELAAEGQDRHAKAAGDGQLPESPPFAHGDVRARYRDHAEELLELSAAQARTDVPLSGFANLDRAPNRRTRRTSRVIEEGSDELKRGRRVLGPGWMVYQGPVVHSPAVVAEEGLEAFQELRAAGHGPQCIETAVTERAGDLWQRARQVGQLAEARPGSRGFVGVPLEHGGGQERAIPAERLLRELDQSEGRPHEREHHDHRAGEHLSRFLEQSRHWPPTTAAGSDP